MKTYWRHQLWKALATCCWLVFFVVASAGAAEPLPFSAGTPTPLFLEAGISAPTPSLPALRARDVFINETALFPARPGPMARRLSLNLFPDAHYLAILERVERNASGSITWIGRLENIPMSQVILVHRDRSLIGLIASTQGVYTLEYAGDQMHRLAQINQAQYPPGAEDTPPLPFTALATFAALPLSPAISGLDDGSRQDVLVAYTPQARAAAGGSAAIQSVVELAVALTNLALRNSQTLTQFQLVYSYETPTDEAGNLLTDLTRLVNRADGYYDEIHAYRDSYHADYVTLLTAADPTYCGMGYLQSTPDNANFESAAFNTVRQACAAGDLTLSHELGHNMGLRHDWYMDAGVTPYPYAHGLVNRAQQWRTVMAYNNWCALAGFSCTRLPYYTNPDILYGDAPMGVPGLTPVNCVAGQPTPNPESCVADGRSVINANADTGARFRISAIYWTGASSADWFDANNWDIIQGPANRSSNPSFTLAHRAPLSVDDVVIPTGLAVYPVISGGSAFARALIIQDGATLSLSDGVLTVTGSGWEEQGSGRFQATGGTVIFQPSGTPQSLITHADSTFHHLELRGGGQPLNLNSDLQVNGNVTLADDSLWLVGNRTLTVGGNWQDGGQSFQPGESTVILNGFSQTVMAGAGLAFYDLQVRSSGGAVFGADVQVQHDFSTTENGVADFGPYALTVEGALDNLGVLRQQRNAPAGVTTEFLHIQNAAGSADKYFGVALTPTAGDLGATTVAVRGGFCALGGVVWSFMVRRCYEIIPTVTDSADMTLYFRSAEINFNPSPNGWRWNGDAWDLLPFLARDLGGVDNSFVAVSQVTTYAPFGVGNPAPLNIGQRAVQPAVHAFNPLSALAGLLSLLTLTVLRRRRLASRLAR